MSKILVDTNVLIYSIDQDSKYYQQSRALLASRNKLFITSKSLAEFYAVVTRAPVIAVSASEALEMIDWFSNSFPIIFPDARSLEILFQLAHKHQPKGLKIHDLEIMSIGIANKLEVIATFNGKDFPQIKDIGIMDLKIL